MKNRELSVINATVPPLSIRPVFIYGLTDPESGAIRYIGKSTRPVERLTNHMNDRSRCHRTNWLREIKARGQRPGMVILERVDGAWPWQESERFWIAYARSNGWPLTNNTSGGDGVPDLPTESRARIASTWKGRKHKTDSIEKMRAASAGRKHSNETKARMSAAHKGRQIKWIDKVAASLRKLSDEQAASIHARLMAGEGTCALAKEFGVHRTTISKIKMGTYYGK